MEKRTKYIKKLAILSLLAMLTLDIMPYFSYAVDYSEETQAEQQVDDTSSDLENHDTENNYHELSLDEQETDEQDAEESDTQIIKEEQEDEDSKDNNTETPNNETDHPSTLSEETPTYIMAKDSDFSGTSNGNFKYIGTDEYVEIPHVIKGVNVTSYVNMFFRSKVKGVKSTNKNIKDMSGMFKSIDTVTLDISQLDTSGVTKTTDMFREDPNLYQPKLLTIIGLDKMDTSKVIHMGSMFSRTRVRDLDFSNFDTSQVTSMGSMFYTVSARELDLSSFDTSKVTNFQQMFYNSANLREIKGIEKWDTSSATNMGEMFYSTKVLETLDVSNFNTSNVVSMLRMFYDSGATELDLRNFDTSKVTDMRSMFQASKAKEIKGLNKFDTRKVKVMTAMFSGSHAKEIDVSSFDTSNIPTMLSMFEGTYATTIKGLENFDTSSVTSMANMFNNSKATALDVSNFNTRQVRDMGSMFQSSHASTLDLRSFNTGKVTSMENMFANSQARDIALGSFDTTYTTSMEGMFINTKVDTIDLSSFDMRGVNKTTNMFKDSKVTTVIAKTQVDKDKLSKTGGNPSSVTFAVKYKIPSDEDFIGTVNGSYRYKGKDDYIEVPHTIRGTKLTSYRRMFENTSVKGVVSTNNNIKDMSEMFKGNTSTELDVSSIDTTNVETMKGMFEGTKTIKLDLRNFTTVNVRDMSELFKNTEVELLDLGSFNLGNVTSTGNMFLNTKATYGYARTQEDLGKLNKSKGKPSTLSLVEWGVIVTPKPSNWTNGLVNLEVESNSGNTKIKDTELVNNQGENILKKPHFDSNRIIQYNQSKVTQTKGVTVPEWNTSEATRFQSKRGLGNFQFYWQIDSTDEWMGKRATYSVYIKNEGSAPITFGIMSSIAQLTIEPGFSGRIQATGRFRTSHNFVQMAISSSKDIDATFYGHKIELGDEMTDYTPPLESTVDEGVFPVYNNGTYIFRATDVNGQSRIVSHTVDNIDREKPTATIKPSTTGFTSQDVTLYVNAEDKLSGIDRIEHPDGTVVKSDHSEFKATENKKYTFKVYDKAGNEESVSYTVTNIDRSIPKLTATLDNTKWTRDPVNITVKSEDSKSGLVGIEMKDGIEANPNLHLNTVFQGKIGDKNPEGWRGANGLNGLGTEISQIVESPWLTLGGKAFHIKVKNDRYYIENSHYIDVKPGEKITTSIRSTSGDVQTWYQFHDKDLNRVYQESNKYFEHYKDDKYAYTLTVPKDAKYFRIMRIGIGTADKIREGEAIFGELKVEKGDKPTPFKPHVEDMPTIDNTKVFQVIANGNYTFKATYNNGATSETSVNVTNIDLDAPTIQVKGNPTEYTDEDDITLEITADDNNQSGVKQITLPDKKVISGDKATYKVNANGDYHFTLEDNVGNKKTYTVTVDKIMIPYKFYIYGKDGKPLKGAGYELYRDGNVHATAESDKDGLVDFGKVPPTGKYTIKQIYAPDGYIVDSEEKEVDVDDVTEPEEIISYPRGDELPSTGTYDYILGIIILFSLTLTGFTLYKNKHEED